MKSPTRLLLASLTLLLLSIPCTSVSAQCESSETSIRPCDDGDPCSNNDEETVNTSDGTICIPCAGTPIDCTNGAISVVACNDGNPSTINDVQSILNCDGSVCVPCAGVLSTPCDAPVAQIDLQTNAVRTRLTTNGSLWNGTYAVNTNIDSTDAEPVNAIFTGSLWIGGLDPGGNLFVRAPMYGIGAGNYGYQPGPLIEGQTGSDTCARWDRFFVATAEEVRSHREIYWAAIDSNNNDLPLSIDQIPLSFLGWPGSGNPHFEAQNGFPLHDTPNGLAPFWDEDLDGIYDPAYGDYPYFCGEQGIWSVFNTENTGGQNTAGRHPMQISVMASAPANADPDLQRTTFYTYTVRNYAPEDLFDVYVGHFIDSDLGCFGNDRTGSIPNELFYVYNDQPTEEACPEGGNGFGENTPVNVFQVINVRIPFIFGIEEEIYGIESHQTFYNNSTGDGSPVGTHDPATPNEAYNYLQGKWPDGSSLQRGGNGYGQNNQEETRFAFDGVETNGTPWLSCTAGVPATDVRSVYSMGPFSLRPGATFSFTLAVTTLFNVNYTDENCPAREDIQERARAVRHHFIEGCRSDPSTALAPESASAIQLEVFPNPVSDLLTFRLPEGERTNRLELLDLTGRVLFAATPNSRNFTINVASQALVPGSYFYRLYTASDRLVTGKVIVRP
jgi:hypothetical protein